MSAADDAFLTAALGNTWAHSVNTRLLVDYRDRYTRFGLGRLTGRSCPLTVQCHGRSRIRIGKSPVAPCESAAFVINATGVEEVVGGGTVGAAGDAFIPQDQVAFTGKNSFFFGTQGTVVGTGQPCNPPCRAFAPPLDYVPEDQQHRLYRQDPAA